MTNTALIQHWMKTVITSGGALSYKLQKAKQQFSLTEDDVILAAGKASVHERLQVYTSGYVLRLLDCMYADFPVLRKFLGESLFDHFAKAYLAFHPSHSFTLYDLGAGFPAFLERTKPTAQVSEDQKAFLDLPVALATLERIVHEVLRVAGTEDEASFDPELSIEMMLFQPITIQANPCLRLLELSFPVLPFYHAVQHNETYDLPAPAQSFIAVCRKNYRLNAEPVQEWQFHFLNACTQPVSLTEAAHVAASRTNMDATALLAELYIWLPIWLHNGSLSLVDSCPI